MKPKAHHFEIRISTAGLSNELSAWWFLKVMCGLLLVTNQLLSMGGIDIPYSIAAPLPLSQLLVLFGGAIFLTHFCLLKRENRRLNQPAHLVTDDGLFPWIRHPMYAGEMMLDIGLGSFALHPASLAVLALALFALYKQAQHEDRSLSRHFGNEFNDWAQHTGLLVPHVR